MNISNVTPLRRNLARTLCLSAAALCLAVLASCMGNSRAMQNGGEVTGQRSAAYNEPAPFGMVEIKRGYLKAGVENNDTLFSASVNRNIVYSCTCSCNSKKVAAEFHIVHFS